MKLSGVIVSHRSAIKPYAAIQGMLAADIREVKPT